MDFFVYLIISLLGGFVMEQAVSRFLLPKAWWGRLIPALLFATTIANKSWIGDENPLILFPFFMTIFLVCYRDPWFARLVSGAIFFSLLEPLCMIVDTINYANIVSWQQELIPIFAKFAVWCLLWLLIRRIVPEAGSLSLSGKLWGLLGGLTLAPLFSTLSFTIWRARDFEYDTYHMIAQHIAFTILPFTMFSAMALLIAIVVLSRHEALEQGQKLAELQKVYYQGLQREQNGVRILRHDLHNHIAAAQGLLERGDLFAAQQYLGQLAQSPTLTGGRRYCENSIANALLSSKVPLMEQKGIDMDIQVSLPDALDFPNIELCALLGNALDNAIEAAEQATERRIALHVRADKGMLMLQVKNTFSQMPKRKNGRFVSSKKDAASHGFGVESMQEIARRYDGICEAEYTADEFCLFISIPLPA